MSEKVKHPFEMWFGLPVCVQLREPYALPRDAGPKEVPLEGGGTKVYGTPVFPTTADTKGLVMLSGNLQPDGGDRVVLLMEAEGVGVVAVGIDPKSISYISAIRKRAEEPRIALP